MSEIICLEDTLSHSSMERRRYDIKSNTFIFMNIMYSFLRCMLNSTLHFHMNSHISSNVGMISC